MKAELQKSRDEIDREQELLWANDCRSMLLVFQAMDAAGKDGTIKHVMAGVNPQGCRVTSFKQPSREELDHDFLWRVNKALPERGQIGIFNRSHYEEVLVVRVHPDWLGQQQLPPGKRGDKFWKDRYESINAFEQHLDRNGTTIVKFFLHVSHDEQRRRFIARLTEPGKEWKFSAADVAERQHWDAYMEAYEKAITATSTRWAPWYVVPADNKKLMRVLVAGVIVHTITAMKLTYPIVGEEQHRANLEALKQLQAEAT
jgi:PPK2 family polyphosphate:nucleotide phosphotransferase